MNHALGYLGFRGIDQGTQIRRERIGESKISRDWRTARLARFPATCAMVHIDGSSDGAAMSTDAVIDSRTSSEGFNELIGGIGMVLNILKNKPRGTRRKNPRHPVGEGGGVLGPHKKVFRKVNI